ncbi:MAG: aldehyde dehydrogenase family protein, partial [Chloroflexi bacterium]
MEYAVNATAFGTFLHQGQICMSARRIIVERPVAKEFTDKLIAKTKGLKVGSPTEMDTIIGPLINKQALEQVRARVDEAVSHGAKVLTGGKVQGSCYEPTLLTDVPLDVAMSKEETFG